jgi:predicted GNAT family N-acyltransferase
MNLTIKVFKQSDSEYFLSLLLRYKILRIPLGLTFSKSDLEKDAHDVHIGIFDKDILLASLILTDTQNNTIKMRQVAVDDPLQGQGVGSQLVRFADNFAKEKGYKQIHCNARKTAVPFYLKQGYNIIGEEFLEVNIPHYYMEKTL